MDLFCKTFKPVIQSLLWIVCIAGISYAQKDTVNVPGYFESGMQSGTLNDVIDEVLASGNINNTVFRLSPYEVYILDKKIIMGKGQNLEIVAPKPLKAGEADPSTVQESAPPQIVWTKEDVERDYIIQSYGDVVMKNVWVRYADVLGEKVQCSISFEDTVEGAERDKEKGYFDGCLFDYAGIGADKGGTVTVKADQFTGIFKNCYFRNNSDDQYRWFGRAVSFPY